MATTLQALVRSMRWEADGILSVELIPGDAAVEFPEFGAGSHIDLHLGNGLVRSYSLCNPSSDRGRYVVGVLHDRKSRGGSRFVHQQLRVGNTIQISAPRNNFQLDESAPLSVLVAGGIGVTPIWCMLQRLMALERPVELIYCARTRKEAAFVDVVEQVTRGRVKVTWHFDEEMGGPPELVKLLAGRSSDAHFYCCGPTPMLDAFERAGDALAYPHIHIERFAAVEHTPPGVEKSFVVELRISNKEVEVPEGMSILDAMIEAGLKPEYSCREGVCGACEMRVVSGDIDHRDSLLTKQEREAGKSMMICVSRCKGERLVLEA